MAARKVVKILYFGAENKCKPDVTGRLLGVVTDKLFSTIKRDDAAANKVLTTETVSVANLVEALEAVDFKEDGARVAIALHTKGTHGNVHGKLLITERVKELHNYTAERSVSMATAGGSGWFRIEETEDKA